MSTTSNQNFWQVADLIPHRHSMLLLEHILAADDDCLWASATTTEQLSSCWGLEFLGQATAALFTLAQLRSNQTQDAVEPTAGMLIGSRRYQVHQPWLEANSLLLMQVTPRTAFTTQSAPSGLVKFQGRLWRANPQALSNAPLSTTPSRLPYDTATLAEQAGDLLVEGDLSVYIPPQQTTPKLS